MKEENWIDLELEVLRVHKYDMIYSAITLKLLREIFLKCL